MCYILQNSLWLSLMNACQIFINVHNSREAYYIVARLQWRILDFGLARWLRVKKTKVGFIGMWGGGLAPYPPPLIWPMLGHHNCVRVLVKGNYCVDRSWWHCRAAPATPRCRRCRPPAAPVRSGGGPRPPTRTRTRAPPPRVRGGKAPARTFISTHLKRTHCRRARRCTETTLVQHSCEEMGLFTECLNRY